MDLVPRRPPSPDARRSWPARSFARAGFIGQLLGEQYFVRIRQQSKPAGSTAGTRLWSRTSCYFPQYWWRIMRRSAKPSIKQLAVLPTAQGGLTRLAANRVRSTGIGLEPLLTRAGLTIDQIADPDHRISVGSQIAFLGAAAEAIHDDFLGLSLAEEFELRELGLLYYIMASSETLGSALRRA